MNLQAFDSAQGEDTVVGTVGGFSTPVFWCVLFGGLPGDERHCWWVEGFAEVDGLIGVEVGYGHDIGAAEYQRKIGEK